MKTIDDSGPAFPVPFGEPGESLKRGMSLRDWFAGMAMQGIHASYAESMPDMGMTAEWAYKQSDAMLEARKKSSCNEA